MDDTTSFFSRVRGNENSMNLCMGCMESYDSKFKVCPFCGYVIGTGPEEPVFLEPGSVLANRYYVGRALGHGSFGVTYIGWDVRLERKVAIKEFLPSEFSTRMPGKTQITVLGGEKSEQFRDGMRKFVDEAKRLAHFQNEPGIVKVYDSFEDNSSAYIVMELLEGRTLTEYLKERGTIPEDEAVGLLMPVMESLQVVHAQGIIHRDISPDNVFICDNGEIKLIDFGASRYATASHTRTITTIIKQGYSPEEQYRSSNDQGPHTDVYALGATLYRMVTGKTPPDGLERRTVYETKGKDLLKTPAEFCKDLSRVREVAILNAMNIDIKDRTPDIPSLVQELQAEVPARRIKGKIKRLPTYRWPKWLKITIPAVAAAAAVFIVLMLTNVIRFSKNSNETIYVPDRYVVVPDIEGKAEAEAIQMLSERGISYKREESIISDYCDPGIVIYQNMIAGAYIEKGSLISYKLCVGNSEIETDGDKVIIPFIKGLQTDTAKAQLEEAGLIVRVEEIYDESEAGLIVSTDPDVGNELEKGSVIVLYISKGEKPFELGLDLKGMKEEAAVAALLEIGLSAPEISYVADASEKGTVLWQDTMPEELVTRGQRISITVSAGLEEELITVPNVKGLSEGDAVKTLKNEGFKVSVSREYSSNVPAGTVIRTSPRAGSSLQSGGDVVVYVSSGPKIIASNNDTPDEEVIVIKTKTTEDNNTRPDNTKADNTNTKNNSTGNNTKDNNNNSGQADQPGTEKDESQLTDDERRARAEEITKQKEEEAARKRAEEEARNKEGDTSSDDKTKEDDAKKKAEEEAAKKAAEEAEWKAAQEAAQKAGEEAAQKAAEEAAQKAAEEAAQKAAEEAAQKAAEEAAQKAAEEAAQKAAEEEAARQAEEAKKHTLSFNGNGGSVSESSRIVKQDETYGSLPTATRDYYTFNGWYTNSSGTGTRASASDVMGTSNVTLYASWTLKPESDWVSEAQVPSDAQITNTKWTYSLTETQTSSSSSLSGWTLVDTSTSYGSWSGWSTTAVSGSDTLQVETQTVDVVSGYNMREYNYALTSGRYYCKYSPNTSAYVWERNQWVSVDQLNSSVTVGAGSWSSGEYPGRNDGGETGYIINAGTGMIYFIVSTTYDSQTQYRTRSITTTYTHTRTTDKESTTVVTAGGDISNVNKWVKYRNR